MLAASCGSRLVTLTLRFNKPRVPEDDNDADSYVAVCRDLTATPLSLLRAETAAEILAEDAGIGTVAYVRGLVVVVVGAANVAHLPRLVAHLPYIVQLHIARDAPASEAALRAWTVRLLASLPPDLPRLRRIRMREPHMYQTGGLLRWPGVPSNAVGSLARTAYRDLATAAVATALRRGETRATGTHPSKACAGMLRAVVAAERRRRRRRSIGADGRDFGGGFGDGRGH